MLLSHYEIKFKINIQTGLENIWKLRQQNSKCIWAKGGKNGTK